MKMQGVRAKAKELGIKTGKKKKVDLIRDIQTAEGNTPCFQTHWEDCDQANCCWRDACDCQTV